MTAWVDYDRHARTCPRDDVWGQVRRTVRGRAVGPEQIDMIVAAVLEQLDLQAADTMLDLACGNGALTSRFHDLCKRSLGVDISPFLIDVANERFRRPDYTFVVQDATAFVLGATEPEAFSKALCYGSLPYLHDLSVARLLRGLHRRFEGVGRVLLGNLPDPARAASFYRGRATPPLRTAQSDLGVWRSPAEIAALAGPGWSMTVTTMPADFFASHYRFDILLERRSS